jgi:hypothetical protein
MSDIKICDKLGILETVEDDSTFGGLRLDELLELSCILVEGSRQILFGRYCDELIKSSNDMFGISGVVIKDDLAVLVAAARCMLLKQSIDNLSRQELSVAMPLVEGRKPGYSLS